MGKEATALVKQLASMTASRWRTTYSKVCGYFKAWMSIAVLRATHSCLRGSRVLTKNISSKIFMHIEDGAGLGMMHYDYECKRGAQIPLRVYTKSWQTKLLHTVRCKQHRGMQCIS
eukprot:scaffold171630_cov34-Attheya_sp.AAC.4